MWLLEDRWWALALLEAEAGTCRDCGQPTAESMSIDNEFAFDATAAKCHGCAAAARRLRAVNDGQTQPIDGLQVSVHRKE